MRTPRRPRSDCSPCHRSYRHPPALHALLRTAPHAQRVRQWLRQHGIEAVIPPRTPKDTVQRDRLITDGAIHCRIRNAIERGAGWLEEGRSLATHFAKLAVNDLQIVKLAFIERDLRLLAS